MKFLQYLALIVFLSLSVHCAIDNSGAYFTGNVQTDNGTGKWLYQYRCSLGHEFWVVR